MESYFVSDAIFQLSLLSSKSGNIKHFTLPIQLVPRLLQACIDVNDILSHATRMMFSVPDPTTLNINWFITCNSIVLSELEGKVMLDYISSYDQEGILHSKFKRFHFITHRISSPCSQDALDHLIYNMVDEYKSIELNIEQILSNELFNEYGMTKKAMRTLEMYDIWLDMTNIIDMSVLQCSSPMECIRHAIQEFHAISSKLSLSEKNGSKR